MKVSRKPPRLGVGASVPHGTHKKGGEGRKNAA